MTFSVWSKNELRQGLAWSKAMLNEAEASKTTRLLPPKTYEEWTYDCRRMIEFYETQLRKKRMEK